MEPFVHRADFDMEDMAHITRILYQFFGRKYCINDHD